MDALAQISKAEQALIMADDIVEMLNLRNKAKAIEIIAITEGYGDIAQQAKIFQLKAERKAGSWLSENITPGRPKMSHDATIKLDDLDLSRSQSSRWQLIATVPDEQFQQWLDDKLSVGQEITAGGLRMYAKNIQGKPQTNPNVKDVLLIPRGCALSGFKIRCVGDLQGHHIINKSMVGGNEAARKILAACPPEIMADCCMGHNIGRLADTPAARKILLLQKIYEFGWFHMAEWFDVLLKTFKRYPTELELERLLSI